MATIVAMKKTLPQLLLLVVLVLLGVFGSQELMSSDQVASARDAAGALSGDVMTVSFLDIGQGDSVYIEAPNGRQVLIDGGAGSAVLTELGRVMPMFDQSIDIVIGTHPDGDHIGGLLDVMKNYEVGLVVDTDFVPEDRLDWAWYDTIALYDLQRSVAVAGQEIVLDPDAGVVITFLYPFVDTVAADVNDGSIALRLDYGETSFLFTGDASQTVEDILITNWPGGLDVDVLKIGHHGSHTSSSERFLQATSPDIAVIQAGHDNPYGHPHSVVTTRLSNMDIPYLCNCTAGRITFETNGVELRKK